MVLTTVALPRLLLGTALAGCSPRGASAFARGAGRVMAAATSRRHPVVLRGPAMRIATAAGGGAPPVRSGTLPSMASSATSGTEGLRLLNSLTRQVEPFEPIDPRLVKWYVCGPTVYDSAHVGHARNYVAFDIVRRVLMEYFGFDILYVMNITDIDDKIILRTHRNHLAAMLAAAAASEHAALAALAAAREAAQATLALPKPELRELLDAQQALAAAASAAGGIAGVEPCAVQAAFLELTSAYEAEFWADMASLNVLPPDAITRVSDYIPEIIAYIEQIRANGYCYEANGSVYFDTAAFASAPGKSYGKLDPTKVAIGQAQGAQPAESAPPVGDVAGPGDDWTEGKTAAELLAEGEGALSAAAAAEKRQPADFVLWKASKLGEPAWASPWGEGRPGWHIECSAMASDLLGDHVDLNSGGVDLKFPHHENQIAQAEAHFDCCNWVNYFLHSGHLKIEGLKMSKSLKNFITVQGALERYSASQLRFLFLLRRFSEPMEYSENTLGAAVDLEKRFAAFSASLGSRLAEAAAAEAAAAAPGVGGAPPVPAAPPTHKWGAEERELHATLASRRASVHAALLDSIDTPTALKALEQLIRATNVYMQAVPDPARGATLLGMVRRYFDSTLRTFGVPSAGGAAGGAAGAAGGLAGGQSLSELASATSRFRDEVRRRAVASVRGGGALADCGAGKGLAPELLELCDELRDEVLPPLGVLIDDRASGVAQVQLGDPKVLLAEAARKAEGAQAAEGAKAAAKAAKAALDAEAAVRAAIPPAEMFGAAHDQAFGREASYGALDGEGLPLEDSEGTPLSKSARKKLAKLVAKQAKAHATYLGTAA